VRELKNIENELCHLEIRPTTRTIEERLPDDIFDETLSGGSTRLVNKGNGKDMDNNHVDLSKEDGSDVVGDGRPQGDDTSAPKIETSQS